MKLGLSSLGCSKNLCDSEVMLGLLEQRHIEITNDPAEADLLLVNTCGFIEAAKEESINTILQMAQYKQKGKCRKLIVTGCLAQRYAQDLFDELPEVDAIVGTNVFEDIVWVVDAVLTDKRILYVKPEDKANYESDFAGRSSHMFSTDGKEKVADVHKAVTANSLVRKLTTPQHFAYIKIAEGCDNHCSYCAIPFIRGRYISKPYEKILSEARELVRRGVKELIVIAQDTTRYGSDLYGKLRLPELLRDLNAIDGLEWIRVMYLYPNNFTDELIEAFASLPKVCKYVDIPLQHASDRLLYKMHRYDKRHEVETLLKKLRNRIPGIVIRTTFIVGFPGETEDDFNELIDFVRSQRFENAGVFTYSCEENTEAAKMPEQIPDEIKEERYHRLMAEQAAISEELHKEMENQVLQVRVESFDKETPNLAVGRSYREAPDIDGDIFIENGAELKTGCVYNVRIAQGFTYEMVGFVE